MTSRIAGRVSLTWRLCKILLLHHSRTFCDSIFQRPRQDYFSYAKQGREREVKIKCIRSLTDVPNHGNQQCTEASGSPLGPWTANCGDAERNISSARKTPANSPTVSLLSRSDRDTLVKDFIWHVRDNNPVPPWS